MLLKGSYLALDMTSKNCIENKEQVFYKARVEGVVRARYGFKHVLPLQTLFMY